MTEGFFIDAARMFHAERESREGLVEHATEITVEAQGRLLKFRRSEGAGAVKGGIRSEVTDYSKASRKRLFETIQRVDWDTEVAAGRAWFVTLTYPGVAKGARASKRDLKVFLQWLKRAWPGVSAFWVLELQARGAPHYHLLCMGWPVPTRKRDFVRVTKRVRGAWERCIGWDAVLMGHHVQVNFRRVKGARECAVYISKYMSKGRQALILDSNAYQTGTGRFWGIHNRKGVPWAFLFVGTLERGKWFFQVRRVVRNFYKSKLRMGDRGCKGMLLSLRSSKARGFSIYSDSCDKWVDVVACFVFP